MKKITGTITRLGNATINKKVTTYSIIEIGSELLQKVRISTGLDSFLNAGSTATLFVRGKSILGIKLEDGKFYCHKSSPISALILIIIGIPLIFLFGLGLILIFFAAGELLNYQVTSQLEREGATPVSF